MHIRIPSSENVSQHNMHSAELCRLFPVKEMNFIFYASSVFLKWVSRCWKERKKVRESEREVEEEEEEKQPRQTVCSAVWAERKARERRRVGEIEGRERLPLLYVLVCFFCFVFFF